MKTQLQAILTKLETMLDKATDLSGSDNETTAERYCNVGFSLQTAIDAINEAIAEFEMA